MSTGNKVAIAAIGVLVIAVVGYYGLRDAPEQAGGADQVKLPDDASLPDPDVPGQLNGQDPALTYISQDPPPTVDPDAPADDPPAADPLIKPLELVQLGTDGPSLQPDEDAPPADPEPADAEPVDPVPLGPEPALPIIDDEPVADADALDDPIDEPTDVRPMPVDVLEQTTELPPGPDAAPDPVEAAGGDGDDAEPIADEQPAGASGTYVVKENDSLWVIARKTLGAGHRWQLIRDANPGIDPDRLKPGQVLVIPAVADAPAAVPEPRAVTEPTTEDPLGLGLNRDMREVVVLENDSLWTIAEREYNDGTKWEILWQANKSRLKSKDSLRVGQKILVPPLPAEE